MKISYYPGCTLKTKAKNLEEAALASLAALGIECEELPRWNCCGAVHSLAQDDLIHHVAPVRDLIRAMDRGSTKLVVLCSMCYNTLERANAIMRDDALRRETINGFMDEESDYRGEVEVVHFLELLRDEIGWEALRGRVKVPLGGLRVAPYYGCTLVRPKEVSIERGGEERVFLAFLEALGARPVEFSAESLCCGSYQVLANPQAALGASQAILESARRRGAEALALSCPLCEFNLSRRQGELLEAQRIASGFPTFYFTQLLAIALGLGEEVCRFDLNDRASRELLIEKGIAACETALVS